MSPGASTCLQLWLVELANAGKSPRTIEAYLADVADALAFCAGRHGMAPGQLLLADVTRDDLVAAMAHFRIRPDPRFTTRPDQAPKERAPATVSRRMAAIKVFFAWAYATQRVAADPAATLKAPKRRERLPKTLEASTAQAALHEAADSRWPERDLLIVVLALTTGLRLEEMATLKLEDLRGDPPSSFTVVGKGNKERRLPIVPVVQTALVSYLQTRTERLERLGLRARTLFISSRPRRCGVNAAGQPVMTVEATRAGIAYVVDRILRRIGARRKGERVHVLRHTFATFGLRPDPDTGQAAFTIRQLQAALGHANLATIQVYTAVADAELERAAQAHPFARAQE